jgi:4'-phosphopantetheinyl transferase
VRSTAARETPITVAIAAASPVPGAALDGLLQADELARAESYRSRDDRARFVTGRALLRVLLAQWVGCAAFEVQLDARCSACGQPHGRPRPIQPRTARAVLSSVSHAGPHVLVAVSRARVGVDVEACAAVDFATFDEIGLSPAEYRRLFALPTAARAPARAGSWVEKEALLKLHGVGLAISPASFDLGASGPDRVFADPLHPRGRIALTHLDVGPDHRACLAVDSPVPPVLRRVNARRLLATAAEPVPSARR